MALRIKRVVKLFPGLRLNIGKTGVGLSAGVRGMHVGINRRGTFSNVGIPGTGVSSLKYLSTNKKTGTDTYIQPQSNFSPLKIILIILFFPLAFTYYLFKFTFKFVRHNSEIKTT